MPQFVISGPPVCNICEIEFKRTGGEGFEGWLYLHRNKKIVECAQSKSKYGQVVCSQIL